MLNWCIAGGKFKNFIFGAKTPLLDYGNGFPFFEIHWEGFDYKCFPNDSAYLYCIYAVDYIVFQDKIILKINMLFETTSC